MFDREIQFKKIYYLKDTTPVKISPAPSLEKRGEKPLL